MRQSELKRLTDWQIDRASHIHIYIHIYMCMYRYIRAVKRFNFFISMNRTVLVN